MCMFLVLAVSFAACAVQSFDAQLADLRAQHAHERQRLDDVRREIVGAEVLAAQAKDRADYPECRSMIASIDADVASHRAQFMNAVATFHGCIATKEAAKGESGFLGCAIGIGIAVLTEGAA